MFGVSFSLSLFFPCVLPSDCHILCYWNSIRQFRQVMLIGTACSNLLEKWAKMNCWNQWMKPFSYLTEKSIWQRILVWARHTNTVRIVSFRFDLCTEPKFRFVFGFIHWFGNFIFTMSQSRQSPSICAPQPNPLFPI